MVNTKLAEAYEKARQVKVEENNLKRDSTRLNNDLVASNFGGSLQNFNKYYYDLQKSNPKLSKRIKYTPDTVKKELDNRILQTEAKLKMAKEKEKKYRYAKDGRVRRKQYRAEIKGYNEGLTKLKSGQLLSVKEIDNYANDLGNNAREIEQSRVNRKKNKVLKPKINSPKESRVYTTAYKTIDGKLTEVKKYSQTKTQFKTSQKKLVDKVKLKKVDTLKAVLSNELGEFTKYFSPTEQKKISNSFLVSSSKLSKAKVEMAKIDRNKNLDKLEKENLKREVLGLRTQQLPKKKKEEIGFKPTEINKKSNLFFKKIQDKTGGKEFREKLEKYAKTTKGNSSAAKKALIRIAELPGATIDSFLDVAIATESLIRDVPGTLNSVLSIKKSDINKLGVNFGKKYTSGEPKALTDAYVLLAPVKMPRISKSLSEFKFKSLKKNDLAKIKQEITRIKSKKVKTRKELEDLQTFNQIINLDNEVLKLDKIIVKAQKLEREYIKPKPKVNRKTTEKKIIKLNQQTTKIKKKIKSIKLKPETISKNLAKIFDKPKQNSKIKISNKKLTNMNEGELIELLKNNFNNGKKFKKLRKDAEKITGKKLLIRQKTKEFVEFQNKNAKLSKKTKLDFKFIKKDKRQKTKQEKIKEKELKNNKKTKQIKLIDIKPTMSKLERRKIEKAEQQFALDLENGRINEIIENTMEKIAPTTKREKKSISLNEFKSNLNKKGLFKSKKAQVRVLKSTNKYFKKSTNNKNKLIKEFKEYQTLVKQSFKRIKSTNKNINTKTKKTQTKLSNEQKINLKKLENKKTKLNNKIKSQKSNMNKTINILKMLRLLENNTLTKKMLKIDSLNDLLKELQQIEEQIKKIDKKNPTKPKKEKTIKKSNYEPKPIKKLDVVKSVPIYKPTPNKNKIIINDKTKKLIKINLTNKKQEIKPKLYVYDIKYKVGNKFKTIKTDLPINKALKYAKRLNKKEVSIYKSGKKKVKDTIRPNLKRFTIKRLKTQIKLIKK